MLDKCQSDGIHLNLEKCQTKKQSRFIPNSSLLHEPLLRLCALLKDNVHFTWEPKHEHDIKQPQLKQYFHNIESLYQCPLQCDGIYIHIYIYIYIYRCLKNITTKSTIGALKTIFTEFGYADVSIQIHDLSTHQMSSSSNVPPTIDISHTISSPYYHERYYSKK